MKKRIQRSKLLMLLAGTLLVGMSTLAGSQYVRHPTITHAVDLIDQPLERVRVNSPATFKLRPSAAAMRVAKQGLVVRIFGLTADQKTPVPIAEIDGCDVYLSVSHKLVLNSPNELRFETITALDKGWLNLSNSFKSVESGHYYLVFEQSTAAQASSEQFRIKKSDSSKYFETGFRLTIDVTGSDITAESLLRQFSERRERIGRLKIEIDQKSQPVPCYSYQAVTVQAQRAQPISQGELHACATDNVEAAPAG